MRYTVIKLISIVITLVVAGMASSAFGAPPEKIFGDYSGDIYDDAKAPVNDKYISAHTQAMLKQGKIKEDKTSVGGIIIEKGAKVFGPIGTNVDTHGGDINIVEPDTSDFKKDVKKKFK